ncbi:MAG: ROK family protein [Bryobacteraceae bacterium]|jgi:glucokinase
MAERLVIGLDLSGTRIAAAVVDSAGTILHRSKQPFRKGSFQESTHQIVEAVEGVVAESAVNLADIGGVGISLPGVYYAATGNALAPDLWDWEEVPLWREIEEKLPQPVMVDNDRAASALGEQWVGAARGLSDVVYFSVGNEIGAGIISSGWLVHGGGDLAGAAGWLAVDPRKNGLYRQVGCLEAEAGAAAVGRRAASRIAAGEPTVMAGLAGARPVTTDIVIEAARRGDAVAIRVLEETARYLAMGIANLIGVLNPEMVVLGGSLFEASEFLLEPLRREVPEWVQPLAASQVRIELGQLGEDARLLGAARMSLLARGASE